LILGKFFFRAKNVDNFFATINGSNIGIINGSNIYMLILVENKVFLNLVYEDLNNSFTWDCKIILDGLLQKKTM